MSGIDWRYERSAGWAATMAGNRKAGSRFVLAHADSAALLGPVDRCDRIDREAAEDAQLAPGATRARGAGRRAVAEEPDAMRTCFERDRDRVLHSTAFRRLAGKTQVFVFPDDHQRTRLTHALEVAQVAAAVARSLRLNVALAEAIAYGHDCGHGPGGHASEDAFSPYLEGGYDHACFGADVVLAPLNLTAEVLDGIRNHSWSRPAPSTPEGEVVSWADRIAYVCHDFEDALGAGVVEASSLPEIVRARCGATRGEQLEAFITGLVEGSLEAGEVGMPADLAEAVSEFRRFNHERIYLRPESLSQSRALVEVLRALVDHFAAEPGRIPGAAARGGAHPPGSQAAVREAVAYVAGMTDRYALDAALGQLGRHDAFGPPRTAPSSGVRTEYGPPATFN